MILGILRADDLWANSVDPDQTAPEGSALFAILSDLGVCVWGGGGRGVGHYDRCVSLTSWHNFVVIPNGTR